MREDTVDVDRFTAALLKAYSSPEQINAMLYRVLGLDLYRLVPKDALEVMVPALIRRFDGDGEVGLLIEAARKDRPGNPLLKTVYRADFAIADENDPPDNLEQVVRATNEFIDVDAFWTRGSEIRKRVCLVVVDGMPSGTGFLVGPSLVLTNDHVITRDDGTKAAGADVVCRFDYTRPGAKTVDHAMVKDGLLASAPWSPRDEEPDPKSGQPNPDHLDFALLEVEGKPGKERGVIELPAEPYPFKRQTPVFIMQHPDADTMKMALDTQGVIKLNDNGTRVRYRTNTLPGSSGSPCFNAAWRLIALHHAGDPRWSVGRKARYNEGIPIHLIRERIKALL